MLKQALLPAVAIATMLAPSAVHAGTIKRQILVEHSDLDLASEVGKSLLASRVNEAIERVCAPTKFVTKKERPDMERCVAIAKGSATAQMQRAIARAGHGGRVASL